MSEAKTILSAEDRSAAAWASWRGQVNSAQRQITGFQQATAAALTAAPLIAFTSGISRAIGELDRLGDQAPKVGLTAQALGELNFASRQNAGGAEVMEGAMGKLSVRIADAAGGSKEAVAVFKTLGVQITDTNGKIKAGDQVLADLADRFAAMPEGPLKTAMAVEVFGKSGKEMLPLLSQGSAGLQQLREEFVRLSGGPVTEAVAQAQEWNDQLDKLWTMSQGYFAHVAQEVLPLLNQLVSDYTSTAEATGEVSTAGTVLRTVLEALVSLGADVGYVFKQTGNEIGAMAAQIAALARGDMDGFRAISAAVKEDAERARQELDRFQERVLNAGALGKISKAAADAEKAFNAGASPNLRSSGNTPVIKKGTDTANKELQEQAKLLAELAGLTGSFADDWARLNALYARGAINVDQLAAAQAELLAKQPAMKKAQQEQNESAKALVEQWAEEAKVLAELAKVMEDYAKANAEGVAGAIDAANQAELELATWGKLKSEVQAVTLAQLEQSRELAALAGEDVSNIEKRIDAQRRLIAATQGIEAKEAIKQLAEDSNREWQKSFDMTRQSLADALMDGGKKGSEYVTGLFRNMVLRPALEYALTPVASGVANIFGGRSGGGGGGAGSLSNLAGGVSNLTGGMSMANTAGSMFANVTGGGLDALLATNGAYGTAAGAGAGLMSGLATALPWVAGGLALASFLEGDRGGPKTEGGADLAGTIQQQYNGIAAQLGITNKAIFEAFYSKDPQGDSLTQLRVATMSGGRNIYERLGEENVGRSDAEFAAAVGDATTRAIVAALKDSDLADEYKQYLNALAADASTADMQRAIDLIGQRKALDEEYLQATSTDAENLARARKRELDAMDPTLRVIKERIWAEQDLRAETQATAALQLELSDALMGQVRAAESAARDAIARQDAAAQSLRRYLSVLTTGPQAGLSPEAQYQATRAEFMRLGSLALDDPERQGKLEEVGNAFLEASRAYNASSMAYFTDLAAVRGAVEASQVSAQANADIGRMELNALQTSNGLLSGILSEQQNLGTTFREAMNQLYAALAGANAVNGKAPITNPGTANSVVTALYQTMLGRAPDAEGLTYWSQRLASGESLDSVRAAMQASAEYVNSHGGGAAAPAPSAPSSTASVVEGLYTGMLGRSSDAEGLAYWSDRLASGESLDSVRAAMQASAEYVNRVNGSHADGLWEVPFDGYIAETHKGERIKTAAQARSEDQVAAEIRALREQVAALISISAATGRRLDPLAQIEDNTRGMRNADLLARVQAVAS